MNKRAAILARLARTVTTEQILAGTLPVGDRQALLLALHAKQAERRAPHDLAQQHARRKLTNPAALSLQNFLSFDLLACQHLPPEFQALELSPVSVLGANSTLTPLSQDMICSAIRNVEVLADPSMALALEAAYLRQAHIDARQPTRAVHLATSHRVLRLQPFDDIPGFTAHFRAFALCSAGRNIGQGSFTIAALHSHIDFYLRLILAACQDDAHHAREITVEISDLRILEQLLTRHKFPRDTLRRHTQDPNFHLFQELGIELSPTMLNSGNVHEALLTWGIDSDHIHRSIDGYQTHLVEPLRAAFPSACFRFDLARIAGMGYYLGPCFKISATNQAGEHYPLVDGGGTDWSQKLLANGKERMVASGFGTELFCRLF